MGPQAKVQLVPSLLSKALEHFRLRCVSAAGHRRAHGRTPSRLAQCASPNLLVRTEGGILAKKKLKQILEEWQQTASQFGIRAIRQLASNTAAHGAAYSTPNSHRRTSRSCAASHAHCRPFPSATTACQSHRQGQDQTSAIRVLLVHLQRSNTGPTLLSNDPRHTDR